MIEPNNIEQTSAVRNLRTGQVYVLFAVSLVLVVTVGSVVQLMSISVGLVITEILLILLPAILFVHWKRLPIPKALRWRAISPRWALLGLAVGVTSWGVAAGIHEVSRPLLGNPPDVAALEPKTVQQLLWVIIYGALLPGFCEETLFRGAIQGVLERRGPRRAVVITALLFAIYHVNPWVLLPALFLGVVFGTLVVRTGSTVPAIVAHIANNATAVSVSFLYRGRPDGEAYWLIVVLAVAFLATFAIFWKGTRHAERQQPILATVPAGVSRPRIWIARIVVGAAVLLVMTAVGAVFMLVDVYTVSNNALEPQVRRGDRLVVLKGEILDLHLEVGDIITTRRGGETVLRKIVRMEGDRIWIRDGTSELELGSKEITGKVVHDIKVAEPSK